MASTVNNDLTITREKPASQAMDYSFLRQEGVNFIQELGSAVWTDYNIHDPGITILEVLAYAITDLSSRAGRPVKDLLASKPGALASEKDFFSAAEILPCSAVTPNDFRKMLIDQDKIRNAWLTISTTSEQAFYLNRPVKTLSYASGEPVSINGLYNVLLEFDTDPVLGDLNSSVIPITTIQGIIEIACPFWDEIPAAWGQPITLNSITLEDVTTVPGEKLRQLDAANDHDYFAILDVTYNGATMNQIPVTIKAPQSVDTTTIKNALLDMTATGLVKEYNQRIIAAGTILTGIKKFLSANRNCGEDFFAFKATRVQEIGITMTMQVAAGVDITKTLAEMFFRLDNFFSPQIPFYTLEEMQAMPGFNTDDIFEGPLLKNGFILDADLEELKRSDIIFTSDLIRIIMSLNDDFNYGNSAFINQGKGIVAVEDLSITNFINNQPITADVRNCLNLTQTDIYKAKLSIDKSDITVLRDEGEIVYDPASVKNAFLQLKAQAQLTTTPALSDIEIPIGADLRTEDYYSIQNDFPLVYGIGHAGLPGSSSNQRKGQAKQLKGFLLFFEQLLANYLSQLAHVKDLFSINAGVNETYFWQLLDKVPDVSPLLGGGYPGSLPVLLKELEQSPSAISRRSNFLDHLLARFGEDFTDLALLLYSKPAWSGPTDTLIQNKSDFLKAYGAISYNRSKSFDYTAPAIWGSDNVPWLKRRICGLLGIQTYTEQDIFGSDAEGFHMIETILLRPKTHNTISGNTDQFLNVPLDGTGNIIEGKKDPYSFRVIFVFPNWPARFADEDFSKYVEKIIQRETPAHILAEVFWKGKSDMQTFETAMKTWLAANALPADETTLTNAKNQFITVINGL